MAKSAMIALLVAAMAVVPIVHGAATLSATGLTVAGRSTAWGSEVCLTPSDISVGASGEFVSVSYDMSNSGDASHAAHNNKLTWDAAAAGIYTDAVSSALAAGAARTVSFEAALTASGIGSKPFDATIHDLTLVFDADGTPITAGTVKVAFCNFATGVCGCTGGAPTGPNIHAGSDLKVVSSSNTVTNTAAWGQVMCLTDADLSTYSAPAPMNDRKLLQATTGFRFQFTEANDGSDATGNFNNELLYDGSRVATATGRSSLAAGATRTALFGSSSNDYIVSLTPDANVHTLKVNMDYLNSVAEASESNVFEIQVAFCMSSGVCGCPASDLTSPTLKTIKGGSVVQTTEYGSTICLTEADWTCNVQAPSTDRKLLQSCSSQGFLFEYIEKNIGSGSAAGAYINQVLFDGSVIQTDSGRSTLAAAASRDVRSSSLLDLTPDANTHTLTVKLDTGSGVSEADEANTFTVNVAFKMNGVNGCDAAPDLTSPTLKTIKGGSVVQTTEYGSTICLTEADWTCNVQAPSSDRKLLQSCSSQGFLFEYIEKNIGSGSAAGAYINQVLFDGSVIQTDSGRSTLAAAASRDVRSSSLLDLTPDANTHTLTVKLDTGSGVSEDDEANTFTVNVAFKMNGVNGCDAAPDLTSPTLKTIKGGSVVQTTEYGSTICLTEADWTCNVQAPSSDRKLLQSCSSQGFLFEYIEKNIGSGSAAGAYINQVLFDGSVIQTDSGRSTLAAAASRDVRSSSLLDLTPDANTHTLTVKLDTGSGVSEDDEANTFTVNVAFKMNGVNGCDAAPDLTSPTLKTIKGGSVVQTTEYGSTICLTEADWTCNVQAPSSDRKLLQSCSSQGFLFEYIEKNIGSASAAGAYINQVLFDGSVIQTDSGRSTLAAAASRDVRSSSLLDLTPDANTHTLTVKLDTGSGVSEADEANTFTANVAFKMNGVNGCDPTVAATDAPTGAPTVAATDAPTAAPTLAATDAPTAAPTLAATDAPTAAPTLAATDAPTAAPTLAATDAPTAAPRTCSPCAGSLVARVDCTCVSALRGSVSLETPIEAFMALGNDKFSESFAGALGLEDPEQVRVLSAQAGSTIVDFAVVPPLGSSSLDIAMEDDLVAKLNAGGLDLGAAYGTPSVLGLTRPNGANAIAATPAPTVAATPAPTGAPVVAATPAPTAADDDVIPPTAPTVKEEEDTPVALYGAIGGGALLVGLCLFFGVRRYRANKKQGEMERNPVASMDEAGLNPKFNKAEVTDVENPKAGAPLSSPAAAPERKPFGELN